MTGMERATRGWHGERGRVTKEMLVQYLGGLAEPVYYLAGPPAMVSGMQRLLNSAGINDDDIRSEEFAGY